MPSSTLQLRAFELSAGPKSARLVTVHVEKSIADVYAHLCSVLKLDAPLSRATFHTTHEKKIDTTPLSTTVPIGSLGLANNSIFVVRVAPRVAPNTHDGGAKAAEMPQTDLNQQRLLSAVGGAARGNTTTTPTIQSAEGRPTDAGRTVDAPAAADSEGAVSRDGDGVCRAAEEARRVDVDRRRCVQHRHVTQVIVLRLFQLLAVLAKATATTPFAAPQRGPTRSTVSIMDLHRDLITAFCRHAGLPLAEAQRLLSHGPHGMDAVYDALRYYAVLPAYDSAVEARVARWLAEHIPPLRPAAFLICVLHVSHEAEYVETALLRLLGHAPTAMTWLRLRDATQLAGVGSCYYSSIAQFGQTAPPTHVGAVELPALETGELDSVCEGWGLYNASYKGHLLALPSFVWSRAVAAVVTGRADAAAHLRELLGLYSEWEAALAWAD